MENYEEFLEKVSSLGFIKRGLGLGYTEYYINEDNTLNKGSLYDLNSLNLSYDIRKDGNTIVFVCVNSGAKSQNYIFQEAYEKIENEFKEKLAFKAFNSHLFKEVETPKEVTELLNKNTDIFDHMVSIENNIEFENKPVNERLEYKFSDRLYELHNLSFYNLLENSRNINILNTYKAFIKTNFGIILYNNKIPKDLPPPKEYNVIEYLKVVAAYQLLLEKGIIKEY